MPTTAHSIVLASRPKGPPKPENFRYESSTLADPADGQFLVRTIWLSLDPYMRGRMDDAKSYAKPVAVDGIMEGGCIAEVMASNHKGFAVGDLVMGYFGWTTYAVSDGKQVHKIDPNIAPMSAYLGVLGMPGLTAWTGLNVIANAQPGETAVISAATGAVGSLAGQLAKQKGMRVIGVAGGAAKCNFAVEELGYDVCLDHRAAPDSKTLADQIAQAAPDGVDVYFENVGGKTLEATIVNMNTNGRIAVCGMIAWYSGLGVENAAPAPFIWRNILTRRLTAQGFIIFDHLDRIPAFLAEVAPMVANGTIKYRETIADGLENAPTAFMAMLQGGNFGKQLVRVGDDP